MTNPWLPLLTRLLCLALLQANATAAAPPRTQHKLACPAALPQEALPLARAPAGWTPSSRGGLKLHAVDITDGPPADMAFLKPETRDAKSGAAIDTWTELDVRRERGIWLACNYGNSDQVILGQRINDNVSECTAKHTKNRYGSFDIEVYCLW